MPSGCSGRCLGDCDGAQIGAGAPLLQGWPIPTDNDERAYALFLRVWVWWVLWHHVVPKYPSESKVP